MDAIDAINEADTPFVIDEGPLLRDDIKYLSAIRDIGDFGVDWEEVLEQRRREVHLLEMLFAELGCPRKFIDRPHGSSSDYNYASACLPRQYEA